MNECRCSIVADATRRYGNRSRLKLRAENEPEPWSKWLIAPAAGYLEADWGGPWTWRDLEWGDVEPGNCGTGPITAVFATAGLTANAVGGLVRVLCME